MKFSQQIVLGVTLTVGFALGTPIQLDTNSSSITSTQVLQLALTLEHLENTFYTQALAQFDEDAFETAGFAPWVRGRFQQISEHEQTHVALLTQVLGNNSVAACNYSFPYTDPMSFAQLSYIFESVGNSAYLGGSQYLVNDTNLLRTAGAILSVEGRQASWVRSSVLQEEPWSGSFDTPIDGNMAYTLASNFITQCPASNPSLPFKAFPSLNITETESNSSMPSPGDNVIVNYIQPTGPPNATYLAFLHGLNTTFTDITNAQAIIPSDLQGFVYAFVTSNNKAVSDDSIIAGPDPLTFAFNYTVPNY